MAPDLLLFALVAAGLAAIVLHGVGSMGYHWQWYRVPAFFDRTIDDEFIPGPLLRGLQVTAEIVLCAAPITLAAGLLTALLRLSPSWACQAVANAYVEIVRNTPLLIQVYVFYFVLGPVLGLARFWVGVLSLSLFEATLVSEVMRGSMLAVPRGQWKAARALGLPGAHYELLCQRRCQVEGAGSTAALSGRRTHIAAALRARSARDEGLGHERHGVVRQ